MRKGVGRTLSWYMNSLVARWRSLSKAAQGVVALLVLSYLSHLPGASFKEGLPTVERVLNFWVLSAVLGLAVWGVLHRYRFAWRAVLVYAVVMLIESAVATTDGAGVLGAIRTVMYLVLLVALTRRDVVVRTKTAAVAATPEVEDVPVNQVRRGIGTGLIVASFVVFGGALRWAGAEQEAAEVSENAFVELFVGATTIVAMLYVLPISIALALIGVYLRKRK